MEFQKKYVQVTEEHKKSGKPINIPRADLGEEERSRLFETVADMQIDGSDVDVVDDDSDGDLSGNEEGVQEMIKRARERIDNNLDREDLKKTFGEPAYD